MSSEQPRSGFMTASPRAWGIAAGLWLALALLTAGALRHLQHVTIDEQARELDLLSLALGDAIERGLRGAEEGLDALRLELRDGDLPSAPAPLERALRRRAELMPMVQSLWFIDREGRQIAASEALTLPDPASFHPAIERLSPHGISLGRPFLYASKEVPMLALAGRLPASKSMTAGGWVLAALPASELLGRFGTTLPTADSHLAVFRSDGVLLAGVNFQASVNDEPAVAQYLSELEGVALRRAGDGTEKLVGIHALPRYGIKVLVSSDLGIALKPWRNACELSALVLALLAVATAAALHFVARANHRRGEAQRALQAQLTRASKLESLGTMAGGVAHDFNNVLAGILGFTEMAQDEAVPGSEQADYLAKVMKATLRGQALAERILAFSRGGAKVSTVFELEPLVEEALTLISASLRPGVVLERQLEAPGARLRGDPTQAFEAVMNLCTNALQAMQDLADGALLRVALRREQDLTPRMLSHGQLAAGDYLALSVTDQGSGITPEVLERLFEPFFTTRRAQSGTGLGLAVVHGVVAEFGGAIDVQSRPGEGARFTLYLPESKDDPAVAQAETITAKPCTGEALLVLDDEPALVELMLAMLRELGYAPEGFSDPALALQRLREAPDRFAALVTDEVMPDMTGTQLTEALRTQGLSLPVLLISGYGGAQLAQRAAAAGVTRVLNKPAQRAEVARALAQMLG